DAPWRGIVAQATGMWLATRLALLLVTIFAVIFGGTISQAQLAANPAHVLLHLWQQWDANWYINIAQRGYFDEQASAFFPLYPLLTGAVSFVLGGAHPLLAAMIVSNLAALGAFIGLGLLAAHEAGANAAAPAIRMLVVYPLAFFLAAPYTESLFLALAVFCIYCARRGNWRWAAACALLAALTRPTGAILFLPMVWEFARQHDWLHGGWRTTLQSRDDLANLALAVGSVPAGFALYAGYLGLRFHHPLIFLHAQAIYWSHQSEPLWTTVYMAVNNFVHVPVGSYWEARLLVDMGPVAIFTVLTLVAVRRMPFSFTLYSLGLIYLAIAQPMILNPVLVVSAGRYVMAAFPIYLLLGRLVARRPWLDLLLVSSGLLLQAIFTIYFLHGNWLI
ncbi:MAG: mannosyltransferase family protein, partial [Ktedonobacterales bacterium]